MKVISRLACVLLLGHCLIFKTSCEATYNYDWSLKMGPGLSNSYMRTFGNHSPINPGLGFHTHLDYRDNDWEYGLASYVNINPVKDLKLKIWGSTVTGRFNLRSVSFGPMVRRNFALDYFKGLYSEYIGAGLLVAQQSLKSDLIKISDEGDYQRHQKITFESVGGVLFLGHQEILSKKAYTFYYEFAYKILRSKNYQIVGGTHTHAITLMEGQFPKAVYEQAILLNIGIILI